MVQITTERFIAKGKNDKKFHLVQQHGGVLKRICTWHPITDAIIIGDKVTCENCQVRQHDKQW